MFVLDKPHRVAEQAVPAFARGETGLRMDLGGFVMESNPSGTPGRDSGSGHVEFTRRPDRFPPPSASTPTCLDAATIAGWRDTFTRCWKVSSATRPL